MYMTILTPNTISPQSFKVRVMPLANLPLEVRLLIGNEETNEVTSISNVTASYDSQDFLRVTASLDLKPQNFYTVEIIQLSSSIDCSSIYRGEIYATTGSSVLHDSKPLQSFTSASNEYIIF